jgi:hypothetical protein
VSSYADRWADAISETYVAVNPEDFLNPDDLLEGEDQLAAARRILTKAAECLRDGVPTTFTGPELDFVRHAMPAHVVHQSFAKRWVLENY